MNTRPNHNDRFVSPAGAEFERRARFWPLALVFALFASAPSACHWPYPDPRKPIIEQPSETATPPTPATAPDARAASGEQP